MDAVNVRPRELDYQIAAARLQQAVRDCKIGFGGNQVWVQIFTPTDPTPLKGSRVTEACLDLVEEILPGFNGRKTGIKNDDGSAGFVFTLDEIEAVRKQLKNKYPSIEPPAELVAENPSKISI